MDQIKLDKITIRAFSDYHVHFRQGDLLPGITKDVARYASRALAMPNTQPAITHGQDAGIYHNKIEYIAPEIDVLTTIKLTPKTTPIMLSRARIWGVSAIKLYPEGVTTHSGDGVPAHALRYPEVCDWLKEALSKMQDLDLVLCLHGEMPDNNPLMREPLFLPFLDWVIDNYPKLRVVLEHITTWMAVTRVKRGHEQGKRVAATITLHHLMLHLGHLLGSVVDEPRWGYGDGKIHPHLHCWPCPKEPEHLSTLVWAATSGLPCFFLGSDSAPHTRDTKESACGCAGVYSAPCLPEALTQLFATHWSMDKLQDFTSTFGDNFYGKPHTTRMLTLEREPWQVPPQALNYQVVPFLADQLLEWTLVDDGRGSSDSSSRRREVETQDPRPQSRAALILPPGDPVDTAE